MIQPQRRGVVVVPKWKDSAIRLQQSNGAGKHLARCGQEAAERRAQRLQRLIGYGIQALNQRALRCIGLKEIRVFEKSHEARFALSQSFIRQEIKRTVFLDRTTQNETR